MSHLYGDESLLFAPGLHQTCMTPYHLRPFALSYYKHSFTITFSVVLTGGGDNIGGVAILSTRYISTDVSCMRMDPTAGRTSLLYIK